MKRLPHDYIILKAVKSPEQWLTTHSRADIYPCLNKLLFREHSVAQFLLLSSARAASAAILSPALTETATLIT